MVTHIVSTRAPRHTCVGTGMCTDMRTCAQTHTDPHMYRIHAGRCAHTYMCTRAHTPMPAHTCNVHTQSCASTYTWICVCTHQAHKHTAAHTCEHHTDLCMDSTKTLQTPPTHVREHKHAHMQTPTCTHAHVTLHTHMHTHVEMGMNTHSRCCSPAGTGCLWPHTHTMCPLPRTCPCLPQPSLAHRAKAGVPQLTIVRVIRSISCLSLVLCCRKGLCLWPRGEKGTQWCPPMPASSLPVPAHSPPEQLEEHAAQ